jgi:hypothetical protein
LTQSIALHWGSSEEDRLDTCAPGPQRIPYTSLMTTKRIAPAVLAPLQDALTAVYWFKPDLRTFLDAAVGDRGLVARIDFKQVKRQIVRDLIRMLDADQHRYFENLLNLLLAVADIQDPAWLKRVEDGQQKYDEAVAALETLRFYVEPYRRLRSEAERVEQQMSVERELAAARIVVAEHLKELNSLFESLRTLNPQPRGYALEKLLSSLFKVYDIDTKGPFRIEGEQIDGAFSFQGTEYLLEAKWQEAPTPLEDLEKLRGKVNRKLDNTLGMFVSINGFAASGLKLFNQGARPNLILTDGMDLAAVMQDRIPLPELLVRKRQHAARTGEIHFSAWNLIGP